MEPELDINDIQGHIFPGFGADYSVLIALRLVDKLAGRKALATLLPEVSTMADSLKVRDLRRKAAIAGDQAPVQTNPSLALCFAASALRSWGCDTRDFDPSFAGGMRNDAASLGDPVTADQIPSEWILDTHDDNAIDVILIAGHSDNRLLQQAVERWLSILTPHLSSLLVEYGRRRKGDKEFFGFKDGISQPAIRGVAPDGKFICPRVISADDPRSNLYAKPGQQLIWPGNFLFGYPRQTSNPLQAGAVVEPPTPWMKNGSYLVFRRLLQDVPAFQAAVVKMEQFLRDQGETVAKDWVAARLVGRWPDGTPLTASPDQADPQISDDEMRINNFRFLSSLSPTPLVNKESALAARSIPAVAPDPIGLGCPRVAHIRQINPRDGTSEIGQENHAGKLMLRRGIAFGPELAEAADADRGLLFLAYQTSIVEQFKFVQTTWANGSETPTGDGLDPIIGQDGSLDTQRRIRFFAPSRRQYTCPFNGRWVVATGGGYFFTPSISGLKSLLSGN